MDDDDDVMIRAYEYTLKVATENGHPEPNRVAVLTVADIARQRAAQEAIFLMLGNDRPEASEELLDLFNVGEGGE